MSGGDIAFLIEEIEPIVTSHKFELDRERFRYFFPHLNISRSVDHEEFNSKWHF